MITRVNTASVYGATAKTAERDSGTKAELADKAKNDEISAYKTERDEKVAAIKQQIDSGEYQIDLDKTAQAFAQSLS